MSCIIEITYVKLYTNTKKLYVAKYMSLTLIIYLRKYPHQSGEGSFGDAHCSYVRTPQRTISTLVGVLTEGVS